ncbi:MULTISPECIES: acyl-CoA dehydrogenase family protein [Mycolicibacter]|uniref:Acyl-CoA dehydrogenase n=1 Tax=Mycolicibacter kumamotonensis TaxID=354243 RepID=A0A7K3L6F3_9MYCO|nr:MULTISPECIES: acyl-CoA dehydrogenase family protein [Mycolicibacter]NDJ88011.1 acyl-CoA dehydrogenase [Mycolicibacter kumamotonensis]RAV02825.1 acyl-CoA dehydrogenase [Mycolicibacter senuensis]
MAKNRTPDAQTRVLIEQSVNEMFAGAEQGCFHRLAPMLGELGWSDVAEEYPLAAEQILVAQHAVSLTTSDLLDSTLIERLTPALATAPPAGGALLLLPFPPGAAPSSGPGRVVGLLQGPPQPTDTIVVPFLAGDDIRVTTVSAADVDVVALQTFDPSVSWLQATATVTDDGHPADAEWSDTVAEGRRLIATEVLALAARALDLTAQHVSARRQYGHSIAAFQVVRHQLAQAQAEIDGARALLAEAATDGGHGVARAAKIAASHAQRAARASALQLSGAIGLTEENILHRYVARAMQLDVLFGSATTLELELAGELFAPGSSGTPLPPLILAC